MGFDGRRHSVLYPGLCSRLEWFDRLYARDRGLAEPHQPLCHTGVFIGRQGVGNLEPEQGEQNRDPLRQDVAPPRRGTRCHRGRALL